MVLLDLFAYIVTVVLKGDSEVYIWDSNSDENTLLLTSRFVTVIVVLLPLT